MEEKNMILLQEILDKGALFPIDTHHFFQSFLLIFFAFFSARYFLKTKKLNTFHQLTLLSLGMCGLLSVIATTGFSHIILRPSLSFILKHGFLIIASAITGYFAFIFWTTKGKNHDA